MPRVTLSTGVVRTDEYGDMLGLEVDRGEIVIDRLLNTSNVDHFELITRVAKIESEIRGGEGIRYKGR